jgi:hypothetical protein
MDSPRIRNIIARVERLEKAVFGDRQKAVRKSTTSTVNLDFEKPLRPFIKQYAKGMSGPNKFTLLLARLVRGDLKKQVPLNEIQAHWDKMTSKSLLDLEFNHFFPAQARENDWVESKKGLYNLRPSWKDIFK